MSEIDSWWGENYRPKGRYVFTPRATLSKIIDNDAEKQLLLHWLATRKAQEASFEIPPTETIEEIRLLEADIDFLSSELDHLRESERRSTSTLDELLLEKKAALRYLEDIRHGSSKIEVSTKCINDWRSLVLTENTSEFIGEYMGDFMVAVSCFEAQTIDIKNDLKNMFHSNQRINDLEQQLEETMSLLVSDMWEKEAKNKKLANQLQLEAENQNLQSLLTEIGMKVANEELLNFVKELKDAKDARMDLDSLTTLEQNLHLRLHAEKSKAIKAVRQIVDACKEISFAGKDLVDEMCNYDTSKLTKCIERLGEIVSNSPPETVSKSSIVTESETTPAPNFEVPVRNDELQSLNQEYVRRFESMASTVDEEATKRSASSCREYLRYLDKLHVSCDTWLKRKLPKAFVDLEHTQNAMSDFWEIPAQHACNFYQLDDELTFPEFVEKYYLAHPHNGNSDQ